MDALHIVDLFVKVAAAVRDRIQSVEEWGPSGLRPGQYTIDVAADEIAVQMLRDAGMAVLSEETGITDDGREIIAVLDPIDGSTNAAAGLPWFGTSICAVDADGPLAAVVVNQATGTLWHAIRGGGAFRDGTAIRPSSTERLGDAIVAVSGLPAAHLGWNQFRCYGAAALDICAVADGTFDAFADMSVDAHGSWDYLGALLVLAESGGAIADAAARDLVVCTHAARRTPVAAATPALLQELLTARAAAGH